jgi:hypothetical protein
VAVSLTINNVIYQYPETGEQNWGEDATAWAQAVTNQINTISAVGDISLTSFNIVNNQSSLAAISGLVFDTDFVRGAFVDYNISRAGTSTSHSETGTLVLTYNYLDTNGGQPLSGNISSISAADPSVITTSVDHGMSTGDRVIISGSEDSTPSVDGFHEITVTGTNTFTIEVNVNGAGSTGTWEKTRWEVARYASGNSGPSDGVDIVIKDNGQGLYTSDDVTGQTDGILKFRARIIR